MAKNCCSVIVVDDNPGDIRLMIEAAATQGLDIEGCTCSTATELIARLDAGERPRMILLDLNMPCISGYDLLKILKSQEEWKTIPAIAYSGTIHPGDIKRAYEMHANCVVNKPHDYDDLKELIRLVDEFWLGLALPSHVLASEE